MRWFYISFILILIPLYSCSPINKQHGYMVDDMLASSDKISSFETNTTTSNEIYKAMGSPSIEIIDVNNVWIYMVSLKQSNIFEEDTMLFQKIHRFTFDEEGVLIDKVILTENDFNKIAFAPETTKVRRDAYGITDQLYESFTRGQ